MISRSGSDFDIILITAEYFDDLPQSPAAVISRVLDAKGFDVGIIEKPISRNDYEKLGSPKLAFSITSGSIDSMLHNYTPLKKKRQEDRYSSVTDMPDRAVIVYCNTIKEYFKGSKIVIGGIEASLRRFAHYDYWKNSVRRSILLDSRADILVYGNGEKQMIEIAEKLRSGENLKGIRGTCVLRRELPESFDLLPSFDEVSEDPIKFCEMHLKFSNYSNLAQEYKNNYVLQFKYPEYTSSDLDWIYSLGFSRKLHPKSLLKMSKFSVVTHRGCIGRCNFCSISLHQGDKIISRSEESILEEIERLTKHPDFKGYIDDIGGPSANMYNMDCETICDSWCMRCDRLDRSHEGLISLLRKVRRVPGVKKAFVRSGIRYDLAIESEEYVRELFENHLSGYLKIAPEHFSDRVLELMNKDNSRFEDFLGFLSALDIDVKRSLRHYLMVGHPGDDEKSVRALGDKASELGNIEQFQLFTPTPMTISSCMYWSGLDPHTLKKIGVVYDYHSKKRLKRILLKSIERSHLGSKED